MLLEAKYSQLPPLAITPKLQLELDKNCLDFFTQIYIKSKKAQISFDSEVWFLEMIAIHFKLIYPTLSRQDLIDILTRIIRLAKDSAT